MSLSPDGYMHVKLPGCCFRCRWWSCNWWCKHPDSKEEQSHITIAGPFSSEEVRPVMLASMVTNQLYCLLESRSSCVSTVLRSNVLNALRRCTSFTGTVR